MSQLCMWWGLLLASGRGQDAVKLPKIDSTVPYNKEVFGPECHLCQIRELQGFVPSIIKIR